MEAFSGVCKIPNCGMRFTNEESLKEHCETLHSDLNQLQCNECGKILSSKQNLREHLFTHSGEKPYKCSECFMAFRQGSQLSAHKRIHAALRRASRDEDFAGIKVVFI